MIWAGVVASYTDLLERWRNRNWPTPAATSGRARRWRQELVETYGLPEENPEFWSSISPNSFLSDLSGPIQLHHGTADDSVPVEFSEKLNTQIQEMGGVVEYYSYENDNHNISNNFGTAITRSVEFFDRYLKGS